MRKQIILLEIILAIISILGFLMRLQGLEAGLFLLMGGLGGLTILYFVELVLNFGKGVSLFSIRNFANLVASFTMIALLFKLMLWLPLDTLLRYALYAFLTTILGLLFNFRISQKIEDIRFYRKALQRSLVIAATAFLIYITPARQLVKRYYAKDAQEVQRAYKRLQINPEKAESKPPKPGQ